MEIDPVPGVDVLPREGNVVFLSRRAAVPAADPKREAIARLRTMLPRGAILYAVRRAHDPSFGWIVCDLYRIDDNEVRCVTADVAHALDCHDPDREVGVKLRRARGPTPLAEAIDGRLSTLLFGAPGAIGHRMLD
jgi:hypothetical protein